MEKLIRDNIPEVARALGQNLDVRTATPEERIALLLAKLVEEAQEAVEAAPEQLLEELADLTEVIEDLAHRSGYGLKDLERERARKRRVLGGFREGYILRTKES